MPEPTLPEVPRVRDERPKILGVLPQNAQARVIAGVSILMVLVIVFSGKNAPKEHAKPNSIPGALEPNQNQIQDYRARIEAETQKLAAEEAELAHTKAAVHEASPMGRAAGGIGLEPREHESAVEPFAQERAKRDYQSLFASNVALSYRVKAPATLATFGASSAPLPPAIGSVINTAGAEQPAEKGKYRIFEGTVLETVLTNRLDSTFSGPVNCMVTTNVYSRDGGHLLIPQGSRVLGEARKLEALGQQRLAVVFHRLILPNAYSVNLDQFHGLDQIGETGLRDVVNHHYLEIFGVSVAIGAFAGLAQINTRYSLDESATDAYRQGVTNSLSQSAVHILDRYLNVLPTFTIREGYRVKVYLSGDLLLPAYEDQSNRTDSKEMP